MNNRACKRPDKATVRRPFEVRERKKLRLQLVGHQMRGNFETANVARSFLAEASFHKGRRHCSCA